MYQVPIEYLCVKTIVKIIHDVRGANEFSFFHLRIFVKGILNVCAQANCSIVGFKRSMRQSQGFRQLFVNIDSSHSNKQ